jgi:hypothetical protein
LKLNQNEDVQKLTGFSLSSTYLEIDSWYPI